MKPLFLPAIALLGMTALSACEVVQAEPARSLITVGCATGPLQFPEYAEEISTACALYGSANVILEVAE